MVNEMMQSKTMWFNFKMAACFVESKKKDASKTDKKMRKGIFSAMFHLEKKKAFLEV